MLAWLTPDSSDFELTRDCRCISVPGELWYLISGALQLLAESHNWEQFGTATPEETAEYFLNVVQEYSISMCDKIGQISMFIGAIPPGWLAMDGNSYTQSEYPSLFDVVPASWKSGSSFTLPNMVGRGIVGNGTGYTKGAQGGAATHQLTVNEIPSHHHNYYQPEYGEVELAGVEFAELSVEPSLSNTGNTGGNQPHNNMPPYVVAEIAIFAGYV